MSFQRVVVVYSPNSTSAGRYQKSVRPKLFGILGELHEIELDNVPYFEAREKIAAKLRDDDLLIAAGGDGVTNVALDAALESGREVIFASIPLGNFNDFSHAINGRMKDPLKILRGPIVNFKPLDISVNGRHRLFVAQYITFGVSAKLTEFLNSPRARNLRQKVRGNGALFGTLCVLNYRKIFGDLGDMSKILPQFTRDGELYRDNNIGFMLGAIGTYFHPKNGDFHLRDNEFWFHRANLTGSAVRDVPYLTSWFGHGVPGEISGREELIFERPTDLITQVGGDKIDLKSVKSLSCSRSVRSLKIFAPRARTMEKQARTKTANRENLA